jgi:hypothetical protein
MTYRRMLAIASLAVFSACEAGTEITPPALGAPTGMAITNQICSGTSTEFWDGTSWVPATVVAYQYPWAVPVPGSSWLAVQPGYPPPDAGTYTFRETFTLPGDSKNLSLDGYIHADNQAVVYLNGVEVFRQPAGGPLGSPWEYINYQNPADPFSAKGPFLPGELNTLTIDVINWAPGPNVAGLDFCASLQYASQSTDTGGGGGGGGGPTGTGNCPSARSIANKILSDLGIKGKDADRILTQVSHHQSYGSTWEGLDKCQPLFPVAVKNFVMALVATL